VTRNSWHLQTRTVNDLEVNTELTAGIAEDKDTDAATAGVEGSLEALPETRLVNDREVLLDITSLGHGDDGAILHVEDSVLLEDRTEHGLNDDAGGGVGDERALLMELLGEEVDTEVSVLAGGGRGRDANHLAWAALENEEVANADVMTGDGNSVGHNGSTRLRPGSTRTAGHTGHLAGFMLDMVVTRLIIIVVTHLGFGDASRFDGFFADVGGSAAVLVDAARRARLYSILVDKGDGLVLDWSVLGRDVDSEGRLNTGTILSFSDVNRGGGVVVVSVYLNARLSEVGSRRSIRLLGVVVTLLLDAGTRAIFFLTGVVYVLLSGFVNGRRVLLPSGLGRGNDLDLLVGGGGGGGYFGLSIRLAVGGWEDAEGDGDASFKVQVGDLWVSRRTKTFRNRPFERTKDRIGKI
jgi:hypothetical protein